MAGTDACGIMHARRWLAAAYSRWRRLYTGIWREAEAQAEAPAILCQTRPLDLEPNAAGGLVQTSGNVEGHQGAIGGFCTPYNSELMLACQVSARRPHYSTAAVPQLVPQ